MKHWENMPEFVQEKQKPFAMVNLRFETQADVDEFNRLTGIKITEKTKSAWFPENKGSGAGGKRWV